MTQKNIKHLTLLHSNDMHGDFLAEEIDNELVVGLCKPGEKRCSEHTLYDRGRHVQRIPHRY